VYPLFPLTQNKCKFDFEYIIVIYKDAFSERIR